MIANLNLQNNVMGDVEIQTILNTIDQNVVSLNFLYCIVFYKSVIFLQTLTTLNLRWKNIDDTVVKHLSIIIKQNRVKLLFK